MLDVLTAENQKLRSNGDLRLINRKSILINEKVNNCWRWWLRQIRIGFC